MRYSENLFGTCLNNMNYGCFIVWVRTHCICWRQNIHPLVFLFICVGDICGFKSNCIIFSMFTCLSAKKCPLRTAVKVPTLSTWSSTSCWEQLSIFCSTFLTVASTSTMLSLVMLVETFRGRKV